jgi:lipid-A-disaccharide synthase
MANMKIFFSAGEPSGDQHAALLISELRQQHPSLEFEGFGGQKMEQQGCRLHFELTLLAVMGFLRVVPLLLKFRRLVKQAEVHFAANPPDAVVLVDFPGFNWWIARAARRQGIPVYYYLPPQLWGWAPWRLKRVKKWVDHVFCSLPFEYEWYRDRGVSASWVGHPFFDEVAEHELDQDLVESLRGGPGRPTVALLPGSRDHEVTKNWPVMLEVVESVMEAVPGVRWVVGSYKREHVEVCREIQENVGVDASLEFFVNQTSEIIEAADCCLMVSGSISLELLARKTPGVVLYRAPRLGRFAARFLMTCEYITLTNLIAGEEVMPEYISVGNSDGDVIEMADHLTEWLTDPRALQQARDRLSSLAGHATRTGATRRTAESLLQALSERAGIGDSERHAA